MSTKPSMQNLNGKFVLYTGLISKTEPIYSSRVGVNVLQGMFLLRRSNRHT